MFTPSKFKKLMCGGRRGSSYVAFCECITSNCHACQSVAERHLGLLPHKCCLSFIYVGFTTIARSQYAIACFTARSAAQGDLMFRRSAASFRVAAAIAGIAASALFSSPTRASRAEQMFK